MVIERSLTCAVNGTATEKQGETMVPGSRGIEHSLEMIIESSASDSHHYGADDMMSSN